VFRTSPISPRQKLQTETLPFIAVVCARRGDDAMTFGIADHARTCRWLNPVANYPEALIVLRPAKRGRHREAASGLFTAQSRTGVLVNGAPIEKPGERAGRSEL